MPHLQSTEANTLKYKNFTISWIIVTDSGPDTPKSVPRYFFWVHLPVKSKKIDLLKPDAGPFMSEAEARKHVDNFLRKIVREVNKANHAEHHD